MQDWLSELAVGVDREMHKRNERDLPQKGVCEKTDRMNRMDRMPNRAAAEGNPS